MKTQLNHLKGKGLVAMPHLQDPLFAQSICYLCQHDEEGTVGFLINKPVKMLEKDLLVDQGYKIDPEQFKQPLLSGGPMQTNRGFVVHTHGTKWNNTARIKKNLFVTNSQEILVAIAEKNLSDNYFMLLGYCAWEPGQREAEFAENDWLICDLNTELLFNVPFEQRWLLAMQSIGIQNPLYLTGLSGHA